MKIAFSSYGKTLDVLLDERFGRAANFVIYDTETKETAVIANTQNLEAAQGAGIQSAMHIVNAGAEAVITGHCGPKAFHVLQTAGIKVYLTRAVTGEQALREFEAGRLTPSTQADVEGHWA